MIVFKDWEISGKLNACQFDDNTAEFRVVNLPLGYEWKLYWNFGSHLNTFNLKLEDNGKVGVVVFKKEDLPFAGIYRAQLMATDAEGNTKHTENTLELLIFPSFSEDLQWAEIPHAFTDYVLQVGDELSKLVVLEVGKDIILKIDEHDRDEAAHEGKFNEFLSKLDEALAAHNEDVQSHIDIRNTLRDFANALNGTETTAGSAKKVSDHNESNQAHSDIRSSVAALAERLNAIANSTDIDLDQLAEIVAYIKSNRGLIESITTTKISYSDIVNNLETEDPNKPLSAKMGAELKKQISKGGGASSEVLISHIADKDNPHVVTKEQVGLGNVPNVATNDQTYTFATESTLANLTSGEKASKLFGKIAKAVKDLISHISNTSNPHSVTAAQAKARPDTWTPSASDVGARPSNWTPSAADVGAVPTSRKVNGKALSSDITLSASDVGARASTWMPTAADVGAIPKTGGNFTGTSVVVGFDHDSSNNPKNKFVAKSGEMVCYGDKILSMYTIQNDGAIYGVNIMNSQLQPNGNAAGNISLGRDGRRFTTVWLVNAANVGSDRNIKENVHRIDERFVEFFDRLEPVSYKLIGNKHDRNHLGFIAQDVKAAMDEAGITDMEFGGYCRDIKLDEETEQPVLDENGEPVFTYSLRYGEFIALNTMMIQKLRAEIEKQNEEIEKLKAEIEHIKRVALI